MKRTLLIFSAAILLSAVIPSERSSFAFALLVTTFPFLLILFALRRDRGWARPGVVLLALWLSLCVAALFWGRGTVSTQGRLGGFPLVTAIQLYGIGLVPLLVTSLLYAATFATRTPTQKDVERLRSLRP